MKIVVIIGSPHEKGTSNLLVDEFIRGAEESKHDVFRFDSVFEDVHPCTGCDKCFSGKCVFDDSMEKLNPYLLEADLIVFVTPLYYFGMSAQLKSVIDRFYANNSRIMSNENKSLLFATSWDANDWTMEALRNHYNVLVKYLNFENLGTILATGCGVRSDIENTDYPKQAYAMGKSL